VLRHVIEKATQSRQSALLDDKVLRPNRLDHTLADFLQADPGEECASPTAGSNTNDDGPPEDISGNSLNWIISLLPHARLLDTERHGEMD